MAEHSPKGRWRPGRRPSTKRGMTLIEMLVVCFLVSIMGIVIASLYKCAYVEFEHASGNMVLSQEARILSDKLIPIVTTAYPLRLNATEAFYHPDQTYDVDALTNSPLEIYEVDFYSTSPYLPYPKMKTATDTSTGIGYWMDSTLAYLSTVPGATGLAIYEPDAGLGVFNPISRSPSIYRYRIAWTHLGAGLDPNVPSGVVAPPNSVYMTRLQIQPDNGALVDSGTLLQAASSLPAQLLAHDIGLCSFTRNSGSNTIQLHIRIYNQDPTLLANDKTGSLSNLNNGALMRDLQGRRKLYTYDYYSLIQLPTFTLGRSN